MNDEACNQSDDHFESNPATGSSRLHADIFCYLTVNYCQVLVLPCTGGTGAFAAKAARGGTFTLSIGRDELGGKVVSTIYFIREDRKH